MSGWRHAGNQAFGVAGAAIRDSSPAATCDRLLPAAQGRSVEAFRIPIILLGDFELCKDAIPLFVIDALLAVSAGAPLVFRKRRQRYIELFIETAHDFHSLSLP